MSLNRRQGRSGSIALGAYRPVQEQTGASHNAAFNERAPIHQSAPISKKYRSGYATLPTFSSVHSTSVVRWDEKVDPRSRMALSYRDPRTQRCNHVDKEINP